jgi:DNA end-binding protein Ku
VHVKDGARIQHRKICPKQDREVPKDEIVSGYEVAPDEYVVLEKDEIKAAAGDRGKVVHIEEFVNGGDIDPIFYEKTYYAGARDDEDAYRLLHDALGKTGRAGIGRFTFHDREYLVAVRALDGVIGMHTLRFHDEVVPSGEVETGGRGRKPSAQEVRMANQLVESLGVNFDPTDYEDTYRDAVLDLIKRKGSGKEIDLAEQEEPAQGDDLLAALEASLGSSNGRAKRSSSPSSSRGRSGGSRSKPRKRKVKS